MKIQQEKPEPKQKRACTWRKQALFAHEIMAYLNSTALPGGLLPLGQRVAVLISTRLASPWHLHAVLMVRVQVSSLSCGRFPGHGYTRFIQVPLHCLSDLDGKPPIFQQLEGKRIFPALMLIIRLFVFLCGFYEINLLQSAGEPGQAGFLTVNS